VREFGKYGVEKDVGGPPSDAYTKGQCAYPGYFCGSEGLLLKMYSAIAILHFAAVLTPKKPNSNAQERTENPRTTHGFQFPKSARLPIERNSSDCPRKVKPVPINTTDVYSLVPPAQKTWHGAVGSTSQVELPRGKTFGLKPAW
jgi:hypothetical protein